MDRPPDPDRLNGLADVVDAQDLCALMSRDEDGFVRWDSAQTLATRAIRGVQAQMDSGAAPPTVEPLFLQAAASYITAVLLAESSPCGYFFERRRQIS